MAKFRRKRFDFGNLMKFIEANEGIEGYLEPQTPTMEQSLLLVARDGSWARSPVSDRGQAGSFCKKMSIPLYDAAVVGYPERMRGFKGKPAPKAPTPEELQAWFSAPPAEKD